MFPALSFVVTIYVPSSSTVVPLNKFLSSYSSISVLSVLSLVNDIFPVNTGNWEIFPLSSNVIVTGFL